MSLTLTAAIVDRFISDCVIEAPTDEIKTLALDFWAGMTYELLASGDNDWVMAACETAEAMASRSLFLCLCAQGCLNAQDGISGVTVTFEGEL
jgi:hypothetical protein